MPTASACPSCGARLAATVTRCDLCGYDLAASAPLGAQAEASERVVLAPEVVPPVGVDEATDVGTSEPEAISGTVACGACGTVNPAGARFCNQCGQPLGTYVAPSPVLPPVAPPSAATRAPWPQQKRIAVFAGVGVVAVLALFGIDRLSPRPQAAAAVQATPAAATAAPAASAPPTTVPPDLQARVDSLEQAIGQQQGALRQATQMELVELYATNGFYGRAAEVQQALAEQTQSAGAWANAGTLWYEHLLSVPPEAQQAIAQQAAAAYQRSLAVEDDPNVRVNLALVYQFDPSNPMGTITELRTVLDANPDHPEANFNMALMRARIGRMDEAIASMEKVVQLTPSNTEIHQRAEQELAAMRAQATTN